MSVDILLATYNGEKYLREQLDSLLNQTYKNINLIVRDDGSTDSTLKILDQYGIPYHAGSNVGVKQNFSHLMSYSKGDYIFFCDQDDVWLPDKVEKSLECMQKMEQKYGKEMPLLVHSDLFVVDQHLKMIAPSFWKQAQLMRKSSYQFNKMLVQNVVTGCTMLINRQLLELSQPIPQDVMMHDWWIALVASAFGKMEALNAPSLYYRQHANNQIGAQRHLYLLIREVLHRVRRLSVRQYSLQHQQVEAFYNRYHSRMSEEQKRLALEYLQLPTLPYFKGRYQIIKNRFLKSGLFRCFVIFTLHKQP